MQGLERYWHVAVPSVRLSTKPLSVRVLDTSLVVFRTHAGEVAALYDRCSHRGVPLSMGEVRDDCVRCPYHGWAFNKDGDCKHVPSLCGEQSGASARRVRAYPCTEQDGYVWVWLGEVSPTARPPSIEGFARSHWVFGSVPVAASYEAVVENNIDFAHFSQVHTWTPPALLRRLRGETPCTVELVPHEGGFEAFTGLTGAKGSTRFDLPYRVRLRIQLGAVPIEALLHCVPVDAKSSRIEWMFRHRLRFLPKRFEFPFEPFIIREDRMLMEAAQRAYDREGDGFERSVPADHVQLAARRLMRWSQAPLSPELPIPKLKLRSFEMQI